MNDEGRLHSAPATTAIATEDRSKSDGQRLLTARELAELLGFAAGTIVDWAERQELPSFKIGGRLRFRLAEVEAWLETQRRQG